jgi:acylphosphatase
MVMSDLAHIDIIIHGQVQGVFFRSFTSRIAKSLGLKGHVHNSVRGTVEVQAEGNRDKLEEFVNQLHSGPPEALVEKVDAKWSEYTGQFINFDIR